MALSTSGIVIVGCMAWAGCACAQAAWTIVDLGPAGAQDLNNQGMVVGDGTSAGGTAAAGYFQGGNFFPYPQPSGTLSGVAWAVDRADVAAGAVVVPDPVQVEREEAIVFAPTGYEVLPMLDGYTGGEEAYAINASGAVAGYAFNLEPGHGFPGDTMAFVFANGVMTPLGTLPGTNYSVAMSINSHGDVAGWSGPNDGQGFCNPCDPFLFHDGVMSDLGLAPGQRFVNNIEINDSGDVVFTEVGNTYNVGFLYSNGQTSPLPTPANALGSSAISINNKGQILAAYAFARKPSAAHYLYEHGRFLNLDTLPAVTAAGWSAISPLRINNAGQIVGDGTHNGVGRSFLLSPD